MERYKYHYTYLIEHINPTDERRYYIGVRSCDCLPAADIAYMGSSNYLNEAIAQNGLQSFQKHIIKDDFTSREAAESHENMIHNELNAAKDPEFYNKKNGTIGFNPSVESEMKRRKTVNDPAWKATIGKAKGRRITETKSSTEWRQTIGKSQGQKLVSVFNDSAWLASKGKAKSKKLIEVFNDPTWLATTGKEKSQKHRATVNDPNWKNTVGKLAKEKEKETKSSTNYKETTGKIQIAKYKETVTDPTWLATTGKDKITKQLATKSSDEYISKHTVICPHCNRSILGKGNLTQHIRSLHR